jgi:hypothetical protein
MYICIYGYELKFVCIYVSTFAYCYIYIHVYTSTVSAPARTEDRIPKDTFAEEFGSDTM